MALRLVLVVITGVFLGVGATTLVYAEGASYLSSDPRVCANCHLMQSRLDSWQKGSHHSVATCVDCHLPADVAGKWFAKGLNGYRHSKAFTLQDFPEPIEMTPLNARILQENCLRCHAGLVEHLVGWQAGAEATVECVHCHRTAGHGEYLGLGGPRRPGRP